ncbi:hypothetical protein P167DRAFT_533956 [Morchella conica CCBAS932]|uniref:Uncharacterized protein n=1 Tax=Morchella conica CCBAS932 TaxID=1392247 RepID=A0A3N4KVF5_9PEZI|nr:hypothetical protein P167DRAFT_533956 [Morchella conica CCBAS932]
MHAIFWARILFVRACTVHRFGCVSYYALFLLPAATGYNTFHGGGGGEKYEVCR